MSSNRRVMFCDRPLRASRRIESPPVRLTSPHKMRRSGIGVSPLGQLVAEFLERYMCKVPRFVRGNLSLFVKRLAVPSTRKLFDDPGGFTAVQLQGRVEIAVLIDGGKSLIRPDMLGQFAAEEIAEGAGGQPRKKIARDDAEPIRRAELRERLLNITRRRPEEAWKFAASQRSECFRGGMLRHFAEIAA